MTTLNHGRKSRRQLPAANEEFVAPEPESIAPDASPVDAVSRERLLPTVEAVSAYAAAASAGPSTAEATTHRNTHLSRQNLQKTVAPASDSSEGESEHATAWANWKQIRESVIGSQLSSQIADTVADLQASSGSAEPESQLDASPATADETSEISNIVDSVLADLKPRLMAEIAKKMSKDKK